MRLDPSVRYLTQKQRMLVNQSYIRRGGAKVGRDPILISCTARVRLVSFQDMTWHVIKRDVFKLPYSPRVGSAFLIYYSPGSLIIFTVPTLFYSSTIIKFNHVSAK